MFKSKLAFLVFVMVLSLSAKSQIGLKEKPRQLAQLQQDFLNLRFGMFIHFNIPTYMNQDWADPEASPSIFNPTRLNCEQWAVAAKSANMSYGCITTKHHSGFCIWDTKTTSYNVMNSPLKRDVVKEYVNAFRAKGLKVFLYYSILDTHHKLRPNAIKPNHIAMVKAQIAELLSNYGKIDALIIDGWDAPWSRISYDDVPFAEIYTLIKSLQPNCLVMDLNGAKYPAQGMYYTDIKTYEMGAGQRVSTGSNVMPALACLPLQQNWFWETNHPTDPVKSPEKIVNEILIPLNKANCNFILNVAPNREGLFDDNALNALQQIGKLWHNDGPVGKLPNIEAPLIYHNLAKNVYANSSWSDDSSIMDFGNDDNFSTSWISNPSVGKPWYEVTLKPEQAFNTIVIAEQKENISNYILEYFSKGSWRRLFNGQNDKKVKVHRFNTVTGSRVRIRIEKSNQQASIAEFEVYNEKNRNNIQSKGL